MPNAFDLLTGNESLFIDLLVAQPASNDPDTWELPNWYGYYTATVVPHVIGLQGAQAQARLAYPEPILAEQLVHLWGVGVYFGTAGLLIYPLPQGQGSGVLNIDYQVAKVLP